MLTILFLIHLWLYPTPRKSQSCFTSTSAKKTNTNCNSGESASTRHSEYAPGPSKSESVKVLKEASCKSNFYTEVAVVAVCRISTSATVEVPEQDLESCDCHFKMSMEDKFRAAVRVIHSLPKDGPYQPSNSTKLKFYGLYKQATDGKNNVAKPGFWDVVGRAKWEAWNKHGDMSKEDAMNQYVDCLKEIVETMSFNGDVEDFLDSIGPFYEFVNLQGSEMSHIKEKIEEVASSSGSSLANSLSPSGANSKESSPLKILNGENAEEEEEEEEEEASTSEKAEVIVETSTATYETKNPKRHSHQNGNAFQMSNGDKAAIPPPAPVHQNYSNQNGFVKHARQNENDEKDEVLTVSTPYVHCKEDLERDIDEGHNSHRRVRITSSIETVASNATSGTESEKYYSGDSEPEMDERFAQPFVNKGVSTSSVMMPQSLTGAQAHSSNFIGNNTAMKKAVINSPSKKLSKEKERVSPKISSTSISATLNPDILTQQTVERLNRDVDHILARLRILEAAYAANAEGAIRVSKNNVQERRRRIFGDLSTRSIAFIVMWPFVVQFLIKLIRWWWRRRRNTSRSITAS